MYDVEVKRNWPTFDSYDTHAVNERTSERINGEALSSEEKC